jgi:hypothetical protein
MVENGKSSRKGPKGSSFLALDILTEHPVEVAKYQSQDINFRFASLRESFLP